MRGIPAKIVGLGDLRRVLGVARNTRHPQRNRVIVLLSFKAGLRACEVAGLEWNMVLDARGCVGRFVEVSASIAKNGSGRRIPMNDDLRRGLIQLRTQHLRDEVFGINGPVIASGKVGVGGFARRKYVNNKTVS